MSYRLNILNCLKKTKKKAPPTPQKLPNFNAIKINNKNKYRRPNILEDINISNPYELFKLFFTDKLLDRLIEYINRNTENNMTPLKYPLKKSPRP